MPPPPDLRSLSSRSGEGARSSGADFEFKHVPYARNVSDEDLLADIRRVAAGLGVKKLSYVQYRAHGRYGQTTMGRRFGGWNAALARAGFSACHQYNVPTALVVADIRSVAGNLKTDHLAESRYLAEGKFTAAMIYRHFGSWFGACEAAGITPVRARPSTVEDLFGNLEGVWRHLGRQPKCHEMRLPLSRYTLGPYQSRFGGFQNALKAFINWKARQPGCTAKKANPPAVPKAIPFRHKTTRTINWRLRFLILRRDHFRCRACGRSPANEPKVKLQIDHIHPWRHGGETVANNLQTLCEKCNGGKSDLPWRCRKKKINHRPLE